MSSQGEQDDHFVLRMGSGVTAFAIAYAVVVGVVIEVFGGLLITSVPPINSSIIHSLALFLTVHVPVGCLSTVLTKKQLNKWSLVMVSCGILLSLSALRVLIIWSIEPDSIVRLVLRIGIMENLQEGFCYSLFLLLGISTGGYIAVRLREKTLG